MPNSGRVGKAQEQAIVRHAKANGFPGADRIIRTGAGKAYAHRADEGDIWLCPGVIVQSKRLKDAAAMERKIPEWLAETQAQIAASNATLGLLIVRRFGTTDVGKWWCFVYLGILLDLVLYPVSADTVPVRLTVADAYTLLRANGYGTPAEEDA